MALAVVNQRYSWCVPLGDALAAAVPGKAPPPGPVFSAALQAQVKKFQLTRGLTPDGDPGANTWRELKAKNVVPALDDGRAAVALFEALTQMQGAKWMWLALEGATAAAPDMPTAATLATMREAIAIVAEAETAICKALPNYRQIIESAKPTSAAMAGQDSRPVLPIYGEKAVYWARLGAEPQMGVAPLALVLLPLAEGASAAVAQSVVAAAGATAAAGFAAWIATKLGAKLAQAAKTAPSSVDASGTAVGNAPGEPPKKADFSLKKVDVAGVLRRAAAILALLAGWLVGGVALVASLLPPLAAAAAAGMELALLALGALLLLGKKKRRR